jgi:hypothetical protein
LDALLAGNRRPQDAAAALRPLAEAIASLNAAPVSSELAAEPGAWAAYREGFGRPAEPARSRPRRHPLLASLLSAKLAAAAALALGGVTAAAYTGVLPAPAQKLFHDAIGAPPAHKTAQPARPSTPAGPDASGHEAYGLCTAYAHLKAHGSAQQKAVSFRNLATAAGGTVNVTAYCAKVAHPGKTPPGKPSSHPAGKPTGHPSGKPTSHPAGMPTSHPTGTS